MQAEGLSAVQLARSGKARTTSSKHTNRLNTYSLEIMHELIPFVKEMISQKPNKKMVKIYVLGSVLAFFGVVIGLVETVCRPFTGGEDSDIEEMKRSAPLPAIVLPQKKEDVIFEKSNPQAVRGRILANRGHAS